MSRGKGVEKAWAEVERLLPERAWLIGLNSYLAHTKTGAPAEWVANAVWETPTWNSAIEGRGDSPVEALEDLARKLAKPGPHTVNARPTPSRLLGSDVKAEPPDNSDDE